MVGELIKEKQGIFADYYSYWCCCQVTKAKMLKSTQCNRFGKYFVIYYKSKLSTNRLDMDLCFNLKHAIIIGFNWVRFLRPEMPLALLLCWESEIADIALPMLSYRKYNNLLFFFAVCWHHSVPRVKLLLHLQHVFLTINTAWLALTSSFTYFYFTVFCLVCFTSQS